MLHDDVQFEQRPGKSNPAIPPVTLVSPRAFLDQWMQSHSTRLSIQSTDLRTFHTKKGGEELEESRTQSERNENSTQPVESQSTEVPPTTRSLWCESRYQHDQSTSSSVRSGLSPSSASLSWSEADCRQPKPEKSNSRLPIRLISPRAFYSQWIQQHKVPPDRIPSVPVNDQQDYPVDIALDDGDARNRIPDNAVGLHGESTPNNLTGSNLEVYIECPSVSPVVPVSDVQLIRPEADMVMSVSNSMADEPSVRLI